MLPQPRRYVYYVTPLQKRTVQAERRQSSDWLLFHLMSKFSNNKPIQQPASELISEQNQPKRILFMAVLLLHILSFSVLTTIRYEGQGLFPIYFSFSTLSDIISSSLFVVSISLLLRAIVKPNSLGRGS